TERPRMAHHTVVFPARYLSHASPLFGGAPTYAKRRMVMTYATPRASAETPPTRSRDFPSRSTASTLIFSEVIDPSPADSLTADHGRQQGVGPGDVVAIVAVNGFDYPVAAVRRAGGGGYVSNPSMVVRR